MSKSTSRATLSQRAGNLNQKFYRLKRRYGYYAIGAVIQPAPNVADMLLKQDVVELAEPVDTDVPPWEDTPEEKEEEPVKRPRGRPRKNPEE